jgi:hypothetical protein
MITIKEKKKNTKKVQEPCYELIYGYMIGDADGDTELEVEVSVDNPYLERFVTLLNKLEAPSGYWGLSLEPARINQCFSEGQINEDDWKFLMRMLFPYYDLQEYEGETPFVVEKENEEYAEEFEEGVRCETEYSFLSLEYVTLKYVDEYGERHDTEIK